MCNANECIYVRGPLHKSCPLRVTSKQAARFVVYTTGGHVSGMSEKRREKIPYRYREKYFCLGAISG